MSSFFLYRVKGCSHCDNREDCPKELKDSTVNLLNSVKVVEEGFRKWETYCEDFRRDNR